MENKQEIEISTSTEEKIKDAARRVFMKKGYAATRTRDIAEESGFNLSLINYYFRSKEKLFDIIMLEHIKLFASSIFGLVNDPNTSLQEKIELLVSHYIDMLIENPDLPIFVLNEIKENPEAMIGRLALDGNQGPVYLVKQWQELALAGKVPNINPAHLLLNLMSMTVFPFIGGPIFRNRTGMDMAAFNAMMVERKKLIPIWIKGMMAV